MDPVAYRIRIGVTGHRKLVDPLQIEKLIGPAIDKYVDSLLAKSTRSVKHIRKFADTPTLYSVLSPLAEGADRIVAKAVLKREGTRLTAVLPLIQEEYMEDFASAESKKEFQELLSLCRNPVLLKTIPISCQSPSDNVREALRNAAYEAAGQYVVDHCDVLLAIWDGEPSAGRGGTAEIVEYAVKLKRPTIRIWSETAEWLEQGEGFDATSIEQVDAFNRDDIPAGELDRLRGDFIDAYLDRPPGAQSLPPVAKSLAVSALLPYFVKADARAVDNQRKYYIGGQRIYRFAALSVAFVAIAVLSPNWMSGEHAKITGLVCFAIELFLLAVILRIHHHLAGLHKKWMENRFLAERIRCGIFMSLCGVEPAPIEVLPFMGAAHKVNDWMVRVFNEVWLQLPRLHGCSDEQCALMNPYVMGAWINDQKNFHAAKSVKEERASKRLGQWGSVVLWTTVCAAFAHVMLGVAETSHWLPQRLQDWVESTLVQRAFGGVLTFFALVLPAVAASLAGLEAQRQHQRLAERSRNMATQLTRIMNQMSAAKDQTRFEELLHRVDEVMLRETQDWLVHVRFSSVNA